MSGNSITKGQKFDRYSSVQIGDNADDFVLDGRFTSPVNDNGPYGFGERALDRPRGDYDIYFEVNVLRDIPSDVATIDNANVIPWFGQPGNGVQNRWNFGTNPQTNTWYSFSDLEDMGYIEIRILESPNNQYDNLVE